MVILAFERGAGSSVYFFKRPISLGGVISHAKDNLLVLAPSSNMEKIHFLYSVEAVTVSLSTLVERKSKNVPRMLCNRNGAISHLQTEMKFLRTSITACTIDKNTFSAPFGISYVRTEI